MHADVQLLRRQCWPLSLGDGWEEGRAWHRLQTWVQRSVPHFPAVQPWTSPLTLLSLRRVMGKMGQMIPAPLTSGGIQGKDGNQMVL